MARFELGVLIFIMTVFLLLAVAPMAVNIWFFRKENQERKKQIEIKSAK